MDTSNTYIHQAKSIGPHVCRVLILFHLFSAFFRDLRFTSNFNAFHCFIYSLVCEWFGSAWFTRGHYQHCFFSSSSFSYYGANRGKKSNWILICSEWVIWVFFIRSKVLYFVCSKKAPIEPFIAFDRNMMPARGKNN